MIFFTFTTSLDKTSPFLPLARADTSDINIILDDLISHDEENFYILSTFTTFLPLTIPPWLSGRALFSILFMFIIWKELSH